MDSNKRERVLAAISAGRLRLRVQNRTYYLAMPLPDDRAAASDAFADAHDEAEAEGLVDDAGALALLAAQGLWTLKDAADLTQVEKDVDELKVRLYRSKSSQDRDAQRSLLRQAKGAYASLLARKHANSEVTRTGVAALARSRALVGRCLRLADGRPVWTDEAYWHDDGDLLDEAVRAANEARPSEGDLRELARTDPWRSTWACRESAAGVFGGPAAAWSDDQRSLVAWSRLYDVARDDQEGPPDWAVDDDDAFDGWLILRRRERATELRKRKADAILANPKLANATEIFVMAESAEEAAEIEELNNPAAAMFKHARLNLIQNKGEVLEAHMPDSQLEIRRQLAARGIH